MAKRDESKWNVEDLTDREIYDAIRYLEQEPVSGHGEDKNDDDKDSYYGVIICLCLYIALFMMFLWLYR